MKLKDYYQVKFQVEGKTRYGVVETFGAEQEKLFKQGILLVDDAIVPTLYEIHVDDVTPIEVRGFGNEYSKYVEAELEKAEKVSDAAGKGLAAGKLFTIGVGDGCAFYVVTKVNKRTCNVEWRGFSPDRYYDHYYGSGRKAVSNDDVLPHVRRSDFEFPKMALAN